MFVRLSKQCSYTIMGDLPMLQTKYGQDNAFKTEAGSDEAFSGLLINPDLNVAAIAAAYHRNGRVRISDFFAAGATELRNHLDTTDDWIQLISTDDGALEIDREERARMTTRRWAKIQSDMHKRACTNFQYSYAGIRVPEDGELDDDNTPLYNFASFVRSKPFLDLLSSITGQRDLHFTDGQATAYGTGDFLTGHDDNVPGKNRIAACVFGLTRVWRLEWGGMLLFHSADHQAGEGIVPQFNTLDLFKVPQIHSVSLVTPAAPRRRLAVTGWLNC